IHALYHLQRALELAEKNFGPESESVAATMLTIASVFLVRTDPADLRKALTVSEKTLAMLESLSQIQDQTLPGKTLNTMAIAHHRLGELGEAHTFYSRALAHFEKTYGPRYR